SQEVALCIVVRADIAGEPEGGRGSSSQLLGEPLQTGASAAVVRPPDLVFSEKLPKYGLGRVPATAARWCQLNARRVDDRVLLPLPISRSREWCIGPRSSRVVVP